MDNTVKSWNTDKGWGKESEGEEREREELYIEEIIAENFPILYSRS
jgi:hypothetical protein